MHFSFRRIQDMYENPFDILVIGKLQLFIMLHEVPVGIIFQA